jgi:hypothetical protein
VISPFPAESFAPWQRYLWLVLRKKPDKLPTENDHVTFQIVVFAKMIIVSQVNIPVLVVIVQSRGVMRELVPVLSSRNNAVHMRQVGNSSWPVVQGGKTEYPDSIVFFPIRLNDLANTLSAIR